MYKVVIIDDEPIIVRGLKKAVKWENLDCLVVGTAGDGVEGLEVIRREKPDILISDISMPKMDGLSMIAALKSEFPDMEVTILTGFRDFDYAQEAIRLGVCRFLLKPSKMEELDEALFAMLANLKNNPSVVKRLLEGRDEAAEENEEVLDSAASSFIVKNALAYIEKNYKERLKLADVADNVYVSQWHLSKLLNKYTGQNFSEILNNVRMEQAKRLLTNPSLRIGDIAEEVGFLDMAHFSRVFKKQVGISANEYRNTVLCDGKDS
ncbi:helix-turn-helix protein [Kineothrix alysoides]|uniref:Stage 0 sporulation protein A homolog n=1 Tax=Kineothrix alysoides TaxID=1469948 RepID=A0A4R1R4H0_9FIRM|nr:response regulator [Kineothrix alysoides]TCL60391.1 helix-turn-helix protein [Kineothrix alysoides]